MQWDKILEMWWLITANDWSSFRRMYNTANRLSHRNYSPARKTGLYLYPEASWICVTVNELLLRMWKVMGSRPGFVSESFISSAAQNMSKKHKVGHDRFPIRPFKLTIHNHVEYPTLEIIYIQNFGSRPVSAVLMEFFVVHSATSANIGRQEVRWSCLCAFS
jgi:hypothetical protein